MLYLTENLKKYRIAKNLTQEDVAENLGITSQSVSRWERGECFPDIAFLPSIANLYETSVDMLLGMDEIRADKTYREIHRRATELQRKGEYNVASEAYRSALRLYPARADMMLGLAGALALEKKDEEAITWAEKGLACSKNEKQNATMRATLCFLYLRSGQTDKAKWFASHLPHMRECREEILPQMTAERSADLIERDICRILLGIEK